MTPRIPLILERETELVGLERFIRSIPSGPSVLLLEEARASAGPPLGSRGWPQPGSWGTGFCPLVPSKPWRSSPIRRSATSSTDSSVRRSRLSLFLGVRRSKGRLLEATEGAPPASASGCARRLRRHARRVCLGTGPHRYRRCVVARRTLRTHLGPISPASCPYRPTRGIAAARPERSDSRDVDAD
jgi:hypothetical protein